MCYDVDMEYPDDWALEIARTIFGTHHDTEELNLTGSPWFMDLDKAEAVLTALLWLRENSYEILSSASVEDARKDVCIDHVTPYTGELDQVSEWAMAVALSSFKVGDIVDAKILDEEINKAIIQQTLDDLHDKGLVEASWDEKLGEVVYKKTQK